MKLTANRKGIRLIPKDKKRRESWLPEDKAWLDTNPEIIPDTKIGAGAYGDVYTVRGNGNIVVKIPEPDDHTANDEEWNSYESLSLDREPLMIPIKSKKVGSANWLIKPRVKEIGYKTKHHKPTDTELEQIRRKLITLSHHGLYCDDGLQLGIDRAGRILMFDLGVMHDTTPTEAAKRNNKDWMNLLTILNKIVVIDRVGYVDTTKYGIVNLNERYA